MNLSTPTDVVLEIMSSYTENQSIINDIADISEPSKTIIQDMDIKTKNEVELVTMESTIDDFPCVISQILDDLILTIEVYFDSML